MVRIDSIRKRCQRGQSLMETALMLIVIFTVIFWVFELSWVFYTYTVLADAANEGVRYGIVHSAGTTTATQNAAKTAIQTQVQNFATASMHNISAMTVTVTWPETDSGGNPLSTPPHKVRVSVSYAYVPYLPEFIGSPTMTAYAEGTMVVN